MKYLKAWDGYSSGREAGYPKKEYLVFDNDEQLASDKDRKNQEVFLLQKIDATEIIKNGKQQIKDRELAAERAEKEKLFDKLKKELGK